MSGEASLHLNLQIDKEDATGNVKYRSYPTQFTADVSGAMGPAVGAIAVSVYGTDVDLSQLTIPGLCRIMNEDPTNYVTYGIRDPEIDKFFPLGELLPGEFYVFRLSRLLGWELDVAGTGTGTSTAKTNKMHFIADTDSCNVLIEAFEA